MRFLAVFLITLAVASTGCSHKKAKPAPEPAAAGNYSPVPGMDTAAAPPVTSSPAATPPDRELKVIPFGAPTTPPPPETAPANNAASSPATAVPAPSPANPSNQKLIVTPDQ